MRIPVLLLTLLLVAARVCAQEPDATGAGETYLQQRTASLERYANRLERRQDRLLRRLATREHRLLKRLRRSDSTAAARLRTGTSFDSLHRRAQAGASGSRSRRQADATLDTLRRIQRFAAGKSQAALPGPLSLDALDDRLSFRKELQAAAAARMQALKSAAGNVPGIAGLEKTAFYTRSRLAAWRAVADQPSKIEEKALEALQGTEGFSEALAAGEAGGTQPEGLSAGKSGLPVAGTPTAADLEKLGFQTKRQVRGALQQQFGPSLDAISGGMGRQVADWQQQATGAASAVRETRASLQGLRAPQKPSFRVNPMRGLPFYQRLEKGYTLNASRASAGRPAQLEAGAQVAFRHTPSLSYGIGVLGAIGLGQDWNHIRLSAEGLGGRGFGQWTGPYGIGAYAGYERLYRLAGWSAARADGPALLSTPHANGAWTESLLLGLTKSYRINAQWNSTVQVLADVWWREKGLQSPLIFRIVSTL